MTEITFIRHGVTDWNVSRRAQGQSDIPLNEEGRTQARKVAARLKNERWETIISSDLSRASETASIIASTLGLDVQLEQRLREMHKGETEGTTQEERIMRWGDRWESLPLGIEDDASIIGRGTSVVLEIAEKYKGGRILLVSHGALIGLTVKHFIPGLDIDLHFGNTSLTRLQFANDKWECGLFNCSSHI